MEIQNEDGSTTLLQTGLKSEFGRGLGSDSEDRTVSRCHVSFQLHNSRVHFKVTGKNPIWVHKRADDEIRIFRSSEDGEMEAGDKFCVSAKRPQWFTLKRVELEGENESETEGDSGIENELAESLQNSHGWKDVEGFDIGSIDVSDIDPVKEFGFFVIGHEFDHYYSKRISQPKSWDWFLEESKKDSEDDDESFEKKGKKRARRKGKKDENNDDEWTGESEEDKELIAKPRKVQKPKYSTRSKDNRKPVQKRTSSPTEEEEEDDEEEEDEEDETLGGFIVTDNDAAEQEEIEDEEEDDFDDEDEDEDE